MIITISKGEEWWRPSGRRGEKTAKGEYAVILINVSGKLRNFSAHEKGLFDGGREGEKTIFLGGKGSIKKDQSLIPQ